MHISGDFLFQSPAHFLPGLVVATGGLKPSLCLRSDSPEAEPRTGKIRCPGYIEEGSLGEASKGGKKTGQGKKASKDVCSGKI